MQSPKLELLLDNDIDNDCLHWLNPERGKDMLEAQVIWVQLDILF